MTEPQTEAGKRLVNDVREVVVYHVTDRIGPGYDLAWHVAAGIVAIEAPLLARIAKLEAGLEQALDRMETAFGKIGLEETPEDREAVAGTLWFGAEEIRSLLTPTQENPR